MNKTIHRNNNKSFPRGVYFKNMLKLPSLFAAWPFWTSYTKSHNMKTLVILSHSWSPFLPLTCFMENINFRGSLWRFLEYLLEKKLLPDYPCKSHDHDHQWADFVMAWLLKDKRKCEHNVVRLVFVYILLSTCLWVHIALAINRPDILVM